MHFDIGIENGDRMMRNNHAGESRVEDVVKRGQKKRKLLISGATIDTVLVVASVGIGIHNANHVKV